LFQQLVTNFLANPAKFAHYSYNGASFVHPAAQHTMTTSYKELLKQREALEQQIGEARKRELSDAVSQVRALVAEFGLTAQDVFPSGRARSASAGTKVAPKYRDPSTGQTWTGRGKAPKWIQNENREKFAI
jgi:DNA-binding protein H-NS